VTPSHIGPYRVLRELGRGHFGTVYLAVGGIPRPDGTRSAPQLVAIKQLREWSMAGFETLVREYELLAHVRHRTLCAVYEFLDRESAVVMEYVHGVTLRQVVDALAGRPMWPDAALYVAMELADCLYQAHATPGPHGAPLGLVHRDVKPANVMLTAGGEVRLLDFGLAATNAPADLAEATVQGTPLYMAPEQVEGRALDHRTDLFAVGLLLLELTSGEAAYPVPTQDRASRIGPLLERVERADVAEPLQRLQGEQPAVTALLRRCLARDRLDRPEDGAELLRDLRRCVARTGGDPLADFAAWCFAELCKLDPTPDVGSVSDDAGGMMAASHTGGPRSAMSDQSPPRPGSAPPRPGASRPGAVGGRPRPKAAERPQGRVPKGGKSWTPPAKDAKPAVPQVAPASSDDGAANLRMVPLSAESSDPELGQGAPPGATEFFALPTPRRQVDDDDEIVDLRRNDPVAAAGRPAAAPPGPSPAGPPPGANPHGGHAPMAAPMPMGVPMGISGPVASGPMPAGYPGGMAPAMPPDPNADLDRAKSYRVFAVVAGLMFMVFTALIASLVVLAYGFYMMEQSQPVAQNPVVAPPPAPRGPAIDTGGAAAPPPPPKAAPRPKSAPKSSPKPAPAAPKPAPPPAPVEKGNVVLKIAASEPYTRAEIKCDSGIRERGSFVGGTATVPNIPGPGMDNCTAVFKGGGALPKATVHGGKTYNCTFDGTFAKCN
jgi:serine/threonine-protein kinase